MDFLILKLQQFGEWPYISWIYDNKTSVSVSFISNFLHCKNNAWKKKNSLELNLPPRYDKNKPDQIVGVKA